MPRNGSGTYALPQAPFVAGTTISSAAVNSDFSDIASALTASLPRNGEAGMSGQLKLADGGTATPSMTFTNDTNSGFFRPTADQVGVVIAGVEVGSFQNDGYHGNVVNGIPVGTVVDFGGSTAPAMWVLCFGQNLARSLFPALFAVIGTAFGAGDGSTTFGLPDLRGSLTFGVDNMGGSAASRLTTAFYGTDPTVLGNRGGTQSKSLITANVPAYTPAGSVGISDPGHGHTLSSAVIVSGAGSGVGGGGAFGIVGNPTALPNTTGITAGFTGSAQGGTSAAFAVLSPGIVMNKIIYAGA